VSIGGETMCRGSEVGASVRGRDRAAMVARRRSVDLAGQERFVIAEDEDLPPGQVDDRRVVVGAGRRWLQREDEHLVSGATRGVDLASDEGLGGLSPPRDHVHDP
jgi:hypothetical protein